MQKFLDQIVTECPGCCSGSCCKEGVELSKDEIKAIIFFNPAVKKPWFRKVDKLCNPEAGSEYETVLRSGTCVFQAKDKRCIVYPVRPSYCRQFPLEDGKLAPFYEPLCDKADKYSAALGRLKIID